MGDEYAWLVLSLLAIGVTAGVVWLGCRRPAERRLADLACAVLRGCRGPVARSCGKAAKHTAHVRHRLMVQSGLTGLWQVERVLAVSADDTLVCTTSQRQHDCLPANR